MVKYVGDIEALAYAASAESKSTHPLAKALVDYAAELGLALRPPKTCDSFPGMGIYAVVDSRSVWGTRDLWKPSTPRFPRSCGRPRRR